MLWNAFSLAQREIRRNVLRSSLTTLGIIIGVSAVIIMVTLGNGATASVTADIANLGSNLLTVMPGQRMGPGGASGSAKPFKQRDVDFLTRDVASVGDVAPVSSQGMSAIVGNKNRSITVTGTTDKYFTSGGWQLASGRFFNDTEMRSGAAVCVIGETVRKELFGTIEVLGEHLRLRSVSCEVIGLLHSKGKNPFGMDRDDVVVMPVRTFQRRLSGSDDINQIQLSVRESVSTERAQQDISRFMRERRRLADGDNDDFSIMDQKELASALSGTTRTMTALLAAIAAVSLLVGGIGIMNIMLVSVTERTREIGLRMAVGARAGDILSQFLVEAVTLALVGGLVGIILGVGGSYAIGYFAGWRTALQPNAIVLAVGFAAGVGVFFGFYPARKASKLLPIEALRYE